MAQIERMESSALPYIGTAKNKTKTFVIKTVGHTGLYHINGYKPMAINFKNYVVFE